MGGAHSLGNPYDSISRQPPPDQIWSAPLAPYMNPCSLTRRTALAIRDLRHLFTSAHIFGHLPKLLSLPNSALSIPDSVGINGLPSLIIVVILLSGISSEIFALGVIHGVNTHGSPLQIFLHKVQIQVINEPLGQLGNMTRVRDGGHNTARGTIGQPSSWTRVHASTYPVNFGTSPKWYESCGMTPLY